LVLASETTRRRPRTTEGFGPSHGQRPTTEAQLAVRRAEATRGRSSNDHSDSARREPRRFRQRSSDRPLPLAAGVGVSTNYLGSNAARADGSERFAGLYGGAMHSGSNTAARPGKPIVCSSHFSRRSQRASGSGFRSRARSRPPLGAGFGVRPIRTAARRFIPCFLSTSQRECARVLSGLPLRNSPRRRTD
jgi:hypothetical protein